MADFTSIIGKNEFIITGRTIGDCIAVLQDECYKAGDPGRVMWMKIAFLYRNTFSKNRRDFIEYLAEYANIYLRPLI